MAGEPYAANGNSRYETQFRNESCHNRMTVNRFLPLPDLPSGSHVLAVASGKVIVEGWKERVVNEYG
jgi:hypothetical protein